MYLEPTHQDIVASCLQRNITKLKYIAKQSIQYFLKRLMFVGK